MSFNHFKFMHLPLKKRLAMFAAFFFFKVNFWNNKFTECRLHSLSLSGWPIFPRDFSLFTHTKLNLMRGKEINGDSRRDKAMKSIVQCLQIHSEIKRFEGRVGGAGRKRFMALLMEAFLEENVWWKFLTKIFGIFKNFLWNSMKLCEFFMIKFASDVIEFSVKFPFLLFFFEFCKKKTMNFR